MELIHFYLEWELLNQLREYKLISEDMAYDAFSYDVEATWQNKEIKQYIAAARKDNNDPDLYGGFTDLTSHYLAEDKNPSTSAK